MRVLRKSLIGCNVDITVGGNRKLSSKKGINMDFILIYGGNTPFNNNKKKTNYKRLSLKNVNRSDIN